MEGERGLAQFTQQPLLKAGGGGLLAWGEHLNLVQSELLLEAQTQSLLILPSISEQAMMLFLNSKDPLSPEGADKLHDDPLVIEEVLVNVHHPVHWVAASNMVHKVPAAEVERDPAVGGGLLVNSESDRHAF